MSVLHDYGCPSPDCDEVVLNHWTGDPAPQCPHHCLLMEIRYFPKSYSPFKPFTFQDDSGKIVTVDSITQARRIERESEKRTAGGDGSPTIFRHLQQDQSNHDKNVFQHLHPQVPRHLLKTRNVRGIPYVTGRGGDLPGGDE